MLGRAVPAEQLVMEEERDLGDRCSVAIPRLPRTLSSPSFRSSASGICDPVRITGFFCPSSANESADAVNAIVSVPWSRTNASKSASCAAESVAKRPSRSNRGSPSRAAGRTRARRKTRAARARTGASRSRGPAGPPNGIGQLRQPLELFAQEPPRGDVAPLPRLHPDGATGVEDEDPCVVRPVCSRHARAW